MKSLTILLLSFLLAGPAAAAEQPLTVMLDWFVNPDHAPLVIAQQKGFFKAEGLKVKLVAPADPSDPPKMVAAGKADIAVTYQPQLQMQVDQGLPLVRIATLVATPLNCLMVKAAGPIHSIADLKGRKVGYSVGGFEDTLLATMLARHGLKLSDVELVNVNFALTPALAAGKVAAVIGAFRNFEVNQMTLNDTPARAFYPEDNGVPPYDELILVANRAHLDDPRLSGFLKALDRAVLYLVNHPKESWKLFIKAYPSLDDKLNRMAWRDTLPRFALRPAALDRARYQHFADFLKRQGVIKKVPALSRYAVVLPH